MEINYEKWCMCEFGPLGTGRMDSNKCPVHDMNHDELLSFALLGWQKVLELEDEIKAYESKDYEDTLKAVRP